MRRCCKVIVGSWMVVSYEYVMVVKDEDSKSVVKMVIWRIKWVWFCNKRKWRRSRWNEIEGEGEKGSGGVWVSIWRIGYKLNMSI